MEKDTLYYDGACPLCRAEIGKLSRHCGDGLVLEDIHRLADDGETPSRAQLLARLHLKTADGRWITGLDANVRAWQHTRFAPLWRVLQWPLVERIARLAYEAWLRARARRR